MLCLKRLGEKGNSTGIVVIIRSWHPYRCSDHPSGHNLNSVWSIDKAAALKKLQDQKTKLQTAIDRLDRLFQSHEQVSTSLLLTFCVIRPDSTPCYFRKRMVTKYLHYQSSRSITIIPSSSASFTFIAGTSHLQWCGDNNLTNRNWQTKIVNNLAPTHSVRLEPVQEHDKFMSSTSYCDLYLRWPHRKEWSSGWTPCSPYSASPNLP